MKTLILSLVFLMVGFTASAQTTLLTNGVVHGLQTSNAAAALADSIHSWGIVVMRDGTAAIDSFQIQYETADSSHIRFFVVPLQDLATETVADSVAGVPFYLEIATGGFTFTTDGIGLVPWFSIVGAILPTRTGAKAYRIYSRQYAVGTELRGNAKTHKVTIRTYK